MARPTKIVVNCETKEEQILELTDEEIAQLEADRAAYEVEKAQREAEEAAKAALYRFAREPFTYCKDRDLV